MIQRVQTLLLLFAMVIQAVLPFISFGKGLFIDGGLPLILILSGALLSFITILFYKKRPAQIVLCRINVIVSSLVLIVLVYQKLILPGEYISVKGVQYIGLALVLAATVSVLLAQKAIRRDQWLVKSSDRLR